MRGGPGGRGRGLRAGTGLAPGAGGVGRAARRWPCWLSRASRGSRRCGRRRTTGSVPGLVSPGGVETACPGGAHGGGKAEDGLVPPTFGGLGGQFARTTLGNLLIGKLGRETNANVLEELRVTSLGAEPLFSFPAP